MNILIADDERMMRVRMEKEIRKAVPDSSIFVASNGNEALEIFTKVDIALVFLDIEMPGMTGLEVAKKINNLRHPIESKGEPELLKLTCFGEFRAGGCSIPREK